MAMRSINDVHSRAIFVGVSHLSLVYASVFSQYFEEVIIFDPDKPTVDALKAKKLIVKEPGLFDALFQSGKSIRFVSDTDDIQSADIVFVAKDIATDKKNDGNFNDIEKLLEDVKSFSTDAIPVVIMSQVYPGFCREKQAELSNIFYFVETLVFGNAIERATAPERIIIGKSENSKVLPDSLRELVEQFNCPVLETVYETAELAKISINLFLASDVTLTNAVAEVAGKIGADWDFIAKTLRSDRRIGEFAYLKPGLGLAGGNIERDIRAFEKLSDKHSEVSGLMNKWNKINENRTLWPSKIILNHFEDLNDTTIGFLGLAYKKDTNSIKNAPSVLNAVKLDCPIIAHDILVPEGELPKNIEKVRSPIEVIQNSDAVVIFNDADEYTSLDKNVFDLMRGNIVIDPFGVLGHSLVGNKKIRYFRL